jgi:hypothetical protein
VTGLRTRVLAPAGAPAPAAVGGAAGRGTPPAPWRLMAAGCLAAAALSLLWTREPTYDPWSWLIWGREIVHGDLVTSTGPSWKPLPVLFTTPFALLDGAAPALWVLVARAGGLLAVVIAYRLAARLAAAAASWAGPVAGAIAALALVLCDKYVSNFLRGNSEGLLTGLGLWAVERHLDGRRRDAFVLGILAALIRPEVWPVIAGYGLWLILAAWEDPPWRGGAGLRGAPWGTAAFVVGGGALLGLLWFVPEYLGSGDFLRAAARAREPIAGSAALASNPFLEVFRRSGALLVVPVYAGALVAIAAALRRRRTPAGRVRLAFAAIVALMMVAVGLMAQGGFTGNVRYVALPAALVCVLAGVGWTELVVAVGRRRGRSAGLVLAAALAVVSAPFAVVRAVDVGGQLADVGREARQYGSLPDAIAAAGGPARVKACGQVFTGNFQVPSVAWQLRVHAWTIGLYPRAPGTVVGMRGTPWAADPRFREVAGSRGWVVRTSCARAGAG